MEEGHHIMIIHHTAIEGHTRLIVTPLDEIGGLHHMITITKEKEAIIIPHTIKDHHPRKEPRLDIHLTEEV